MILDHSNSKYKKEGGDMLEEGQVEGNTGGRNDAALTNIVDPDNKVENNLRQPNLASKLGTKQEIQYTLRRTRTKMFRDFVKRTNYRRIATVAPEERQSVSSGWPVTTDDSPDQSPEDSLSPRDANGSRQTTKSLTIIDSESDPS